VVAREPLRVLDRQSFPLGVAGVRAPVENMRIVVLRNCALGPRRRAPLLADHTAVDLRDAHAGELPLAHGHDALFVDRVAERAGAHAHLGPERPYAHLGIGLAFRNVDMRHYCTPNNSHGLSHAMRRISASVNPSAYRASA